MTFKQSDQLLQLIVTENKSRLIRSSAPFYTCPVSSNCTNREASLPLTLFSALLCKPGSQSTGGKCARSPLLQCAKCQRPISLPWPSPLGLPPTEPWFQSSSALRSLTSSSASRPPHISCTKGTRRRIKSPKTGPWSLLVFSVITTEVAPQPLISCFQSDTELEGFHE